MGLVEKEWGAVFWKPAWESWRSRVVFFSYQQILFLSGKEKLMEKSTEQSESSLLILSSSDYLVYR